MAEKVLREAINIDPTAFEAWLVHVFLIFYFQVLLLFSRLCHGSRFVVLPNAMFTSRPMQSFG